MMISSMLLDAAACAMLMMALAGQQSAAETVQQGVAAAGLKLLQGIQAQQGVAASPSHLEAIGLELSYVSSSQLKRNLQQQGGGIGGIAAASTEQPPQPQPLPPPVLDAALVSATLKWSSQQLLKAYLSVPSGMEPQQVGRKP